LLDLFSPGPASVAEPGFTDPDTGFFNGGTTMTDYQTHQASWQGIALSVRYCPDWSQGFREVMGRPLAHFTIAAGCALPITETGNLSHFTGPELVDAEGGPVAFVLAWLDLAAQSPEWKAQREQAAQLSLF
jgi:hypothetical protein